MYRDIIIKVLSYIFNFKDKSEIIVIAFRMHFFLCSYSCNLYQIEVSHSLTLYVWHKIIQLV